VPESRFPSRNGSGTPAPSSLANGQGGEATRGALRLRVLWSLPQSHKRYLYGEVQSLCTDYLRRNRIPAREITTEELVSEVWLKLLGTVSRSDDEEVDLRPEDWTLDDMPERDARVVWLIREIGGWVAIGHRHADILRSRFGRGHVTVQVGDDDDPIDFEHYPEDDINLRASDAHRVWQGLLAVAIEEFGPEEDVARLLHVMAREPDIFEESSGRQWPVKRLVALLNEHFPPPDWDDRRVEDAKRRLTKWVNRLGRKNALDTTDLQAMFARVTRLSERVKDGVSGAKPVRPILQS
jgi:hypothetical protein